MENKEVTKRLDAMIGLMVENLIASGLVGKGRAIEILSMGGLGPTEIGKIVDLPSTSIGSILTRQKKQKRKKRESRKAKKQSS